MQQGGANEVGSSGGGDRNQLEQSRWGKYLKPASQESSSTDEEVEEGLSAAEQARNERLADLSNCLAEYGRRNGETEEQIAKMQSKLRERMLGQAPRLHFPSPLNQVQGRVDLHLTPGVQYVITIPQPEITVPNTIPSQQSQPLPSAKKFVCGTCAFESRDNYNLKRHMKVKHTVVEGGLECER